MQATSINYAPSTFEDRGASVAFTTPLLSQTRIRRGDRDRLEVLVPSLSEGIGIYVIPWKSVPEMVAMTVHDRYLHDLIVKSRACSPHEVRRATLKAARRGLAGPLAVKAAREALQEDEEQRTLTNYLLILSLLEAAGLESADALTAGLDTDDGQRQTRGLMAKAAAGLDLEAGVLYARVAELSEVIGPVGLSRSPKPGRLHRNLEGLRRFRDSIDEWSRTVEHEAAPVAAFCAEVARHTLGIGEGVHAAFNGRVGAIGRVMRDWDGELARIRALAGRLSWLLDGWEHVVAAWDEAKAGDRHAQGACVHELFRIVPLVPRSESDRDMVGEAQRVASVQRRSVRMHEDWRTGRLDVEAIARIEKVKARAA